MRAMAAPVAQRSAGMEAWAAHGLGASLRAQRVAAAVRGARHRAERALTSVTCDAFQVALIEPDDPFARVVDFGDNGAHRAVRDRLRSRRKQARDRLAGAERAEKALLMRIAQRDAAEQRMRTDEARREKMRREEEERNKPLRDHSRVAATQAALADPAPEPVSAPIAKPVAPKVENLLVVAPKVEDLLVVAPRLKTVEAAAPAPLAEPVWPADAAATRDSFKALVEHGSSFGASKEAGIKRARLALKKAINLAGNQVAASERQVARCVSALCGALRDAHRHGHAAHAWAAVEVSRRLVSDASSAEQGAAQFALAYVLSGVVKNAPDVALATLALRGVLLEECVYTAPVFPRRKRDESNEAYRKRIGARDGEDTERYANRMAAVVGLYAALLTTNGPFSITEAWRWLARVVNAKRQPPLAPAMLVAFLDAAGHDLSLAYRRQFAKLMAATQARCLRLAAKSAPPGPRANLQNLINTFIEGGCVFPNQPPGKTLPASDAVNV